MEGSKRKIRTYLIVIALIAVAGGVFYYFIQSNQGQMIKEGTLISKLICQGKKLWQ